MDSLQHMQWTSRGEIAEDLLVLLPRLEGEELQRRAWDVVRVLADGQDAERARDLLLADAAKGHLLVPALATLARIGDLDAKDATLVLGLVATRPRWRFPELQLPGVNAEGRAVGRLAATLAPTDAVDVIGPWLGDAQPAEVRSALTWCLATTHRPGSAIVAELASERVTHWDNHDLGLLIRLLPRPAAARTIISGLERRRPVEPLDWSDLLTSAIWKHGVELEPVLRDFPLVFSVATTQLLLPPSVIERDESQRSLEARLTSQLHELRTAVDERLGRFALRFAAAWWRGRRQLVEILDDDVASARLRNRVFASLLGQAPRDAIVWANSTSWQHLPTSARRARLEALSHIALSGEQRDQLVAALDEGGAVGRCARRVLLARGDAHTLAPDQMRLWVDESAPDALGHLLRHGDARAAVDARVRLLAVWQDETISWSTRGSALHYATVLGGGQEWEERCEQVLRRKLEPGQDPRELDRLRNKAAKALSAVRTKTAMTRLLRCTLDPKVSTPLAETLLRDPI